jgi:hypothetical protein
MLVKHHHFSFYKNYSEVIVKETSARLFDLSEVKLTNIAFESIQPDARFLFANLKCLRLDYGRNGVDTTIQQIANTLDHFEEINTNNQHLDFIHIGIAHRQATKYEFQLLAKHRIQSLALTSNEIDSTIFEAMKDNLNCVTELSFSKRLFESNKIINPEENMLDFCAQTLVKLKW